MSILTVGHDHKSQILKHQHIIMQERDEEVEHQRDFRATTRVFGLNSHQAAMAGYKPKSTPASSTSLFIGRLIACQNTLATKCR